MDLSPLADICDKIRRSFDQKDQAREKGLVDELGNLQDAIDIAAKDAGIKGKPNVVNMGRPSPLGFLMSEAGAAAGRAFAETLVREGVFESLDRVLSQPKLQLR